MEEIASEPVWSRDGKTLYFLDTGRNLMAVNITVKGGALEAGPPVKLFATKMRPSLVAGGYDVTREGRFLVNTSGEEQSVPAVLVVNWAAGLKK